jgi:hypothetical protein
MITIKIFGYQNHQGEGGCKESAPTSEFLKRWKKITKNKYTKY